MCCNEDISEIFLNTKNEEKYIDNKNYTLRQISEEKQKKISIVVCCMNRLENLKKVITNWLEYHYINQIVVLDYGSNQEINIDSLCPKKKPNTIEIYRVDADHWHLTRAYNIAMQYAKGDIIIKMDADYIINPGFFEHHYINSNSFIHGGPRTGYLWGFLTLLREHFYLVNGYNERLINYGHDDTDMFNRLSNNLGLLKTKINKKYLYHIPHSHASRIENQNKRWSIAKSCRQNILCASINPWTLKDRMTNKNVARRIY